MPVPTTPQDLIDLIREKLFNNTSGLIEEPDLREVLENIVKVLDAKFSMFSPNLTEEQFAKWNLILDYMAKETKGVLSPTSPAPTDKGKYLLSSAGTYTNLGGLVTTADKLNYAYFNGSTWSLIAADLPQPIVNNYVNNNTYNLDPNQIVPSEALYNNPEETLAGDIIKRVDINTGENVNYRETTTWYDGSAMTDAKTDGIFYKKFGVKYYENTKLKRGDINIKDCGAKGDGSTNDTDIFEKVLSLPFVEKIYCPSGVYIVDGDSLIVTKPMMIVGDGETTIFRPPNMLTRQTQNKYTFLNIKSSSVTVQDVFISWYGVGIKWKGVQRIKIERCTLTYNVCGIMINEGYINRVTNCNIIFNNIGLLSLGQSYELLIDHNIIDNNIGNNTLKGGVGLLFGNANAFDWGDGEVITNSGTMGAKVLANVNEGNRNLDSGAGCAIMICQVCSSAVIENNWFETNYENGKPDYSFGVDILLGGEVGNENEIQEKIVSECIPSSFQSTAEGTAYGSLKISNNFHYHTKYGVVVSWWLYGILKIEDSIFSGRLGMNNVPIFLAHKVGSFHNSEFVFNNNIEQNTENNGADITAEMKKGIGNSIIYSNPVNETNGSLSVLVNGKDLFTKEVTLEELVTNHGMSTLSSIEHDANSSAFITHKLNNKYDGMSVTVNNYAGSKFNTWSELLGKTFEYIVFIGTPGATVQSGSFLAGVSRKWGEMIVYKKSNTELETYIFLSAGNPSFLNQPLFGYITLTQSQYDNFLRGCTKIKIKDFHVTTQTPSLPMPINADNIGKDGMLVTSKTPGYKLAVWNGGQWNYIQ